MAGSGQGEEQGQICAAMGEMHGMGEDWDGRPEAEGGIRRRLDKGWGHGCRGNTKVKPLARRRGKASPAHGLREERVVSSQMPHLIQAFLTGGPIWSAHVHTTAQRFQ